MDNKQEELEATKLLESCNLVAISETWWNESRDWSTAIQGYRLFRRDRRGTRSRGVALCEKKWTEYEELSPKNSHEQAESLWGRIRDRGIKGNLEVDVYYRLPNQGEHADKDFLLHLQEASRSQALNLLGNFDHINICWKSNAVICRQSRRLLECIEENFLSWIIDSPIRGNAIPNLLVVNASELIRVIKTRGSLGCSDHALIESAVLRNMGQVKSKVRILNFTNLQLFKELVNRTLWETASRDKGAEQSWQIVQSSFHRAQEFSIPRC